MRTKRSVKFKKLRHQKIKKYIIYTLVLPGTFIFLGYLFTVLLFSPQCQANLSEQPALPSLLCSLPPFLIGLSMQMYKYLLTSPSLKTALSILGSSV